MASIPFNMMLYVFMGSEAEKGGLQEGQSLHDNRDQHTV